MVAGILQIPNDTHIVQLSENPESFKIVLQTLASIISSSLLGLKFAPSNLQGWIPFALLFYREALDISRLPAPLKVRVLVGIAPFFGLIGICISVKKTLSELSRRSVCSLSMEGRLET